jgi:tryptophan-rich sensory protein
MNRYLKILLIFLIINFLALAIGGWLMDNGPQTNWYLEMNKAPWTPAGWVFGFAWITIMICFSFYMTSLYLFQNTKIIKALFVIQVLLNVSWSYVFFNLHWIEFGLLIIIMLTLLIIYFFTVFLKKMRLISLLILPYMIWLLVATSLNLYVVLYN